ncbi:hypothetical protein [Streptomyces sp. SAI-229]|uniref:hypothetical protein n=1 Tax=Streptomyces sp. SAI-229 TaxID=3377731 RepID=UPI003C7B5EE5
MSVAVFRKTEGDTHSGHVRRWFGPARPTVGQPSGRVRLRRFSLLAYMTWLTAHFLTGGWL